MECKVASSPLPIHKQPTFGFLIFDPHSGQIPFSAAPTCASESVFASTYASESIFASTFASESIFACESTFTSEYASGLRQRPRVTDESVSSTTSASLDTDGFTPPALGVRLDTDRFSPHSVGVRLGTDRFSPQNMMNVLHRGMSVGSDLRSGGQIRTEGQFLSDEGQLLINEGQLLVNVLQGQEIHFPLTIIQVGLKKKFNLCTLNRRHLYCLIDTFGKCSVKIPVSFIDHHCSCFEHFIIICN